MSALGLVRLCRKKRVAEVEVQIGRQLPTSPGRTRSWVIAITYSPASKAGRLSRPGHGCSSQGVVSWSIGDQLRP
jgi:hypothetical protein